MIVFVVTFRGRGVLSDYLQTWARHVPAALLFYEDLPGLRSVPAATYVFTDLERLAPDTLALASELAAGLERCTPAPRILNHPRQVLTRYALLETLHDRGINPFRAYRLSEAWEPLRFPVFLRLENEHDGALTPLLHAQREVERAIALAYAGGLDLDALLLVEFCDTADDEGVYRKYGAVVVDGAIVPQVVFFGRHWMLKWSNCDPGQLELERRYVESNPHAQRLLEIARLAGVEYGRFDYTVANGELRIWELNTNPAIALAPDELGDADSKRSAPTLERVNRELLRLDRDHRDAELMLPEPLPAIVRSTRAPRRHPGRPLLRRVAARAPGPFVRLARRSVLRR